MKLNLRLRLKNVCRYNSATYTYNRMGITWYGSPSSPTRNEGISLELRELNSQIWVSKDGIAPIDTDCRPAAGNRLPKLPRLADLARMFLNVWTGFRNSLYLSQKTSTKIQHGLVYKSIHLHTKLYKMHPCPSSLHKAIQKHALFP